MMKIHEVTYGPGVPAHPVFRAALEALPDRWGIPATVWISPRDQEALGLPARIGPGHPMLGIFVQKTKKLGELPHLIRVLYANGLGLPIGKMAFGASRAHRRARDGQLFFYAWRCNEHEDCLENPVLGQACLASAHSSSAASR